MIWGYHYFWKHPCVIQNFLFVLFCGCPDCLGFWYLVFFMFVLLIVCVTHPAPIFKSPNLSATVTTRCWSDHTLRSHMSMLPAVQRVVMFNKNNVAGILLDFWLVRSHLKLLQAVFLLSCIFQKSNPWSEPLFNVPLISTNEDEVKRGESIQSAGNFMSSLDLNSFLSNSSHTSEAEMKSMTTSGHLELVREVRVFFLGDVHLG